MTLDDVYLILPEISMTVLAIAVVIVDLFIKNKKIIPYFVCFGLIVPIIFSSLLWIDVSNTETSQLIGFWNSISVDFFALSFKFLTIIIIGLVSLASIHYLRDLNRNHGEYYALLLFSSIGLMLLPASRDLIGIYLALELSTLPMIILVNLRKTALSGEATVKFFVLNAISSAIILLGMVILFGATGTTNITDIALNLGIYGYSSVVENFGLLILLVLFAVGFGFKIGMVPVHMWIPDVYQAAPMPIVSFLSVASKAGGFAILLVIFYKVFGAYVKDWSLLFGVLSCITMTLGNIVALRQNDIKRLLGYSSIAHAGYLLIGVAANSVSGNDLGTSSVLFYLVAYAATNLVVFFILILLVNMIGSHQITNFGGLARKMPWIAIIFTVALISLIGLPPTGLFVGKIYLFSAAIKSGLTWLAIVGVINSVISAYYYLRIVRVLFVGESQIKEKLVITPIHATVLIIPIVIVIFLGIYPSPLLTVARKAVEILS